jgi:beta-fructofuranosidase
VIETFILQQMNMEGTVEMQISPFKGQRTESSQDPHRPQFHFLPEKGWMNDPNGLIQWGGRYHLFYQYNPNGPFHGSIHWGHAVSDDLLHWEDLPVALAPTPGGADAEGCWSGCAIDHDGLPTLVYTGTHPQVVCLATSSDGLVNWEKHPANPVLAGPPPELETLTGGNFRDPFVWKEDKCWYMAIGSRIDGQGGVILRYRSEDLVHWEYLGRLLQGDINLSDPFWTGSVWECPNFFRLKDRYVLFFSVQSEPSELLYPVYYIGDYDGEQFIPTSQSILVHGSSFYAPQVMRTGDGRMVMWGWLKEMRWPSALMEAGWAGVMSMPLTLLLLPNGRLGIEPVEELKNLRGAHWHYANLALEPGTPDLLDGVSGDCLEIDAVFEPDPEAEFGLKVRCSPDRDEQTRILYQGKAERLVLDPKESSLSTVVDRDVRKASLSLDASGCLRLHIFIDRSVVEIFANGHTCLAGRVYPTRADSLGVGLLAPKGVTRLVSLDIWQMKSIWQLES